MLEIEADSGLRVMAINILGKFLTNRDNNIRYVALHTLNKVVSMDTNAVQRHRNTILDCLRDGDISIRRRALELSYALVNETNIRIMTRELLSFLEVADNEFKLGMTTQITLGAERFAPNKRWQIDTVLRVLTLAGNHVREEILASFIRLVCHTPELQFYTAHRLFTALSGDLSQESLTLAAIWVIGEFADVLLQGGTIDDQSAQVSDSDIVDLFDLVLNSPYANTLIRQFVLVAASKVSARLSELSTPSQSTQRDRIAVMLAGFSSNLELEIQQRAVEFASLFSRNDVKAGVLERMPPPEIRATMMGTVSERKPVGSTRTDKDTVVDLIGDDIAAPVTNGSSGPSTQDLLADIFGSSTDDTSLAAAPETSSRTANSDIMSLFNTSSQPAAQTNGASGSLFDMSTPASDGPPAPAPAPISAAPAASSRPQLQAYPAYDKHGLKVTLTPRVSPTQPGVIQILAKFTATSQVEGVNFQVAVPKVSGLSFLGSSSIS